MTFYNAFVRNNNAMSLSGAIKNIALSVTVFATLSTSALALDQGAFEARINEITSKYEPQLDALGRQAKAVGDNAPSKEELMFNVDLDEKSEVRFSMHIPEITMDRWEYSMHIPEVTFKLREFSWHVPETAMKITRVGPVKLHLPQVTMRLHKWSTKVPEVTMRHRKFSMDIPEVTMRQRDFSFHLPKVTVGGPRDRVETMKSDGQAIQVKSEALAEQMQSEISAETRSFLNASREEAAKQFDFGLSTLNAGIKDAPNENIRSQLVAQRSKLRAQKTQALSEIDNQLNALS